MIKLHTFSLILAAMLAQTALHAEDDSAKADRLLAEAKAASGGAAWDHITSWRQTGALVMQGVNGKFDIEVDLSKARFDMGMEAGGQSMRNGWTGIQAWMQQGDAPAASIDDAGEAVRAHGAAALFALAYWYPDRAPVSRRYAGERKDGAQSFDAIEVKVEGGEPLELWIDRKSHLIVREVELGGEHPEVRFDEDFRKVDGVTVPFRSRGIDKASGQPTETSNTEKLVFNHPLEEAHLNPLAAK